MATPKLSAVTIPLWSLKLEIFLQPGAWGLPSALPSLSSWRVALSNTYPAALAATLSTIYHPVIAPTSPIAPPGMLALAIPTRLRRKVFHPGPTDTAAQPISAAPE